MSYLFRSFLILVTLFFIVVACQKDEAFTEEEIVNIDGPRSYPGVATSLWPYFERFERAGAEQGVEIDLVRSRITGVIENIPAESVAGQCNFYSHSPNHVIIDSEFWSRASDNFKEMIVFHELGHCILNRDHREGRTNSGFCVSIMRSGELPCRDAYTDVNKPYYVEELFHPERVD